MPQSIETEEYTTYATFMEHFRNYLRNPTAYEYYIQKVRTIGDENELSPREVDMALWAFDTEKM